MSDKRKAGQPTKYNKNTIPLSEEYIKECVDQFSKNSKTVKLPKAAGLALKLGVNKETLYEWAKHHKNFSNILKKINQLQEERVINQSLAGNYNANIAKLLLGKHGYSEKTETKHSGEISLTKLFEKSQNE